MIEKYIRSNVWTDKCLLNVMVLYHGRVIWKFNLKKWASVIQMHRRSIKRTRTSQTSSMILILELKEHMICLSSKTNNNTNKFPSLKTYCVSGVVLNILHTLSHLTAIKLWGWCCSDKKPEALSDQIICPRLQN